jgi:ornithine lipid ester-linked acyl 2-hydroxylase
MNKYSCESEDGYKYTNTSWNRNDKIGINIFLLFIITFFCIVYSILRWSSKYTNIFISILILNIFIIISILYWKPIYLLYSVSSILSLFIRTPPFLDRKLYFANHSLFENPDSFEQIYKEVDAMLNITNKGNSLTMVKDSYNGENEYIGSDIKTIDGIKRGWRLLNIKVGNTYTKDALTNFPVLVSILEKVPEITSCVISVLEPGIRIPIHTGYYKGVMRYMLPTHVPKDKDNVFLCANGIKYNWTKGEGVLWDDTYAHKVYNNTDESRVIIYMDVIRPISDDSNSIINKINRWFIQTASETSIVKDEIKRTEIQVAIQ